MYEPALLSEASEGDIALLRRSLHTPNLVFLDGFHSVKHALRFGADMKLIVTSQPEKLLRLAGELAPDLLEQFLASTRRIGRSEIPAVDRERSHWTQVWGVAQTPNYSLRETLLGARSSPLVLLEDPKNFGNIGASIRVAAAAEASGMVILGESSPWHPAAVRGAAGLQFALPVGCLERLETDQYVGPVVALDPDGELFRPGLVPNSSILVFGTEREGLSDDLARKTDLRLRLPMREGVSSLNLAVTIGITLYLMRFCNDVG